MRGLVIFILLFNVVLPAQTTLSTNDLIVVTVNADEPKNFDFVPLVDLDAGTEIFITDKGWDGSAFCTDEGTIKFTAASEITAGTVISFSGEPGNGFVSVNGNFTFSATGDNLLFFQGSEEGPDFKYGIGWANADNWIESGTPNTNQSCIPLELSKAKYSIIQLGSKDNYQYDITKGTNGSKTYLQALIAKNAYWTSSDVTAFTALSATFTFIYDTYLSNHVCIAEIYPAGGNSGATYKYDYIVLYNPFGSDIDVSTWSIQYTGSGLFEQVTNLVGTITANSYYLIQEGGGDTGSELPHTPNVIGTIAFNANYGKIALVNNQEEIEGKTDGNVVDFVGYGTVDDYVVEPAEKPGDASCSIRRKDDSGYMTYGSDGSGFDTDNNYFDFYMETDIASNPPLPVELVYFDYELVDNNVILKWETATEINNYGFEIERASLPADDWKKIGFVEGHGNSNSPKQYSFTDTDYSNEKDISYRLKQIDTDGTFQYYSNIIQVKLNPVTSREQDFLLHKFVIEQNYPNPFNPVSRIKYRIANAAHVNLEVFDVLGRSIEILVDELQSPGNYQVEFDGINLQSGVYYYRIEAGEFSECKKMLLLK